MLDTFKRRHSLLAALCLLVSACASSSAGEDGEEPSQVQCRDGFTVGADGECAIPSLGQGDVDTPPGEFEEPTITEDQTQYFLNQEGNGQLTVYVNQTIDVGIRVITFAGEAAPERNVNFEIVPREGGEIYGAVLSARRSTSNEFGVASVQLTGGEQPSRFYIEMASDQTTGLRYTVDVVLPPEGGDLAPPGAGGDPPPGGFGGACLNTKGVYDLTNLYEPANAVVGQGVFEVLDSIHRLLSNPGGFVAELIEDRIDGFWGSVIRAAVEPVVNYVVEFVISNYAPDWVRWTLLITEDVTAILTNLEIKGTLELGEPEPMECRLTGAHTWDQLVFIWRAGCQGNNDPNCGRFPVDMNQLGVNLQRSEFEARVTRTIGPVADMEIYDHQMSLNLAVAVIWFVENFILPQRLNVNSFGELIGLVIPCDAVGRVAADYLSGVPFVGFAVAPFVERACEAGLRAAGDYLTRQLTDSLSVDVFAVTGSCKLRDSTGNMSADQITEGRWEGDFPGDFTGQRRQ